MQLFKRLFIPALFLFVACGNEESKRPPPKNYTARELLEANKSDARREADVIDAYIRQHHWNMERLGTGLRYEFLFHSPSGDTVKTGNDVQVNYKIYLLDGTLCYSSAKDGIKTFRVGEDHVESGIHEAVRLMKAGDSLRCVLPSNRAHGLLGDGDKIPPRSPVMYEIKVVDVR
jgi:FKBP-type peptidyl-prolyl cis-trans isomerase FkpA